MKTFLKNKFSTNESGFTLAEVMIAMTIFATFITAFVTSQGYRIVDSALMRENITLRHLAQTKLNEVIINPPALSNSLTLKPETKKFEDNEEYQYTITYQKFIIPDLSKLKGQEEGAQEVNPYEAKVFELIKDNMEKLIWQVDVSVKSLASGNSFNISTWLYNDKAEVKVDAF